MGNKTVADLKCGGRDDMDLVIVAMYGKKAPEYAVYRTAERVLVQYADSKGLAGEQRRAMARLSPLRGQINGLIDGWRHSNGGLVLRWPTWGRRDNLDKNPKLSSLQRRAERYDRRVADALVVGFENDVICAEAILIEIKNDILDERISWARFEYLIVSFAASTLLLMLLGLITHNVRYGPESLDLWRGAAAGTVGAFFSIALSIRSRTVLPDLQRAGNMVDAALRILIGLIAGALLLTLLGSHAVTLKFGDAAQKGPEAWLFVLVIGFVAGFSERFVPDLLAKVSGGAEAAVTPSGPHAPSEEILVAAPVTQQPTAPTGATRTPSATANEEDAEATTDHCLCEIGLKDEEVTTDLNLPPAAGGVATTAAREGSAS